MVGWIDERLEIQSCVLLLFEAAAQKVLEIFDS